ncbi:MAG TPA: nucleotidyltransferase family protein [Mycobacterium sp.]|nr:nucleotidyltransferase family protein [Mycobacterium sp.]
MITQQVTGVVLAAGGSSRFGTAKQVLPYRNTTLLGATLDVARGCGFDQIIVTVGGAEHAVRDAVALDGIDVVAVEDFGTGCSASLRVALGDVRPGVTAIVLMLGDQPGVDTTTVHRLMAEGKSHPVIVCRYTNGLGHPFWFSRSVFGELMQLHGDKGVWKLLHSGRLPVHELTVDAAVPLDVDTWADYQRLVESGSS